MDFIISKNKLAQLKALSEEEKKELKENMLNSFENQMDNDLFLCLVAKVFSIQELKEHVPTDNEEEMERVLNLERQLLIYADEQKKAQLSEEKQRWNEIENTSYRVDKRKNAEKFILDYPDGNFANQVKELLVELEENLWQQIGASSSIQQLELDLDSYLAEYPEGAHVAEAKALKDDLPWARVVRNPNLAKLREYEETYPGKHVDEIADLRSEIEEDMAWAEVGNDKAKAKEYKEKCHSSDEKRTSSKPYRGKYIDKANEIINRPESAQDTILKNLKSDCNYYPALILQEYLGNYRSLAQDLLANGIFDEAQLKAISSYVEPKQLPSTEAVNELKDGFTEIYFWGTKNTGKTCALGAILSAANKGGIFKGLPNCSGSQYMSRLSELFKNENICTLPAGTGTRSMPAMTLEIKDSNNRAHKMMFVDFAGEVVHAMYKQQYGIYLNDDEKESLARIQAYLKDSKNNKIHFFVVEYGYEKASEEIIPGVTQGEMLSAMATYLSQNKIYTKSTVGVYCLVTKCDKIDCKEKEERPEKACDYVITNYPSFWNQVVDDCVDAQIAECKTLSFSIGKVFAQSFCRFIPDDTTKVINMILSKTEAERKGWLGRIINILRR